jgi:hypothetical protein
MSDKPVSIWRARLPGFVKYGIQAYGKTEKEAIKLCKKGYLFKLEEISRNHWVSDDYDTWKKAQEYFCLHTTKLTTGDWEQGDE